MPRTPAQLEAARRDGPWCLWHRHRLSALLPLTDVHHLARRKQGTDLPELCIGLCHQCHMAHHAGWEPTTSQLLKLMLDLYGLNLSRDFAQFFARYADD